MAHRAADKHTYAALATKVRSRYASAMHGRGKPVVRRDLFGGSGEVAVWDLMQGARIEPFTAALACELSPGGSVGVHVQEEFPEIVICIDGSGTATVDGEITALSPGVLLPLPLGKSLSLSNSSLEAPLHYIIVKGRAL